MEMRKFIVELHSDGRMTWAEYEEPGDSGAAAYHRGCAATAEKILKELDDRKAVYENNARSFEKLGFVKVAHDESTKAEAMKYTITALRRMYHM